MTAMNFYRIKSYYLEGIKLEYRTVWIPPNRPSGAS